MIFDDLQGISYSVVEDLVLLLPTRHEGVLGEVVRTRAVLGICALDLLVECLHIRGKQPMKLECIAFFFGECWAFVEIGSSKERVALLCMSVSGLCNEIWQLIRTVKLVSCGPEVDRGRWPNFSFFCCFPLGDMFESSREETESDLKVWSRGWMVTGAAWTGN